MLNFKMLLFLRYRYPWNLIGSIEKGVEIFTGVSRTDRKQKTYSYSVWTTSWDWVFFKGLVLSSSRYLRSSDMHTFSMISFGRPRRFDALNWCKKSREAIAKQPSWSPINNSCCGVSILEGAHHPSCGFDWVPPGVVIAAALQDPKSTTGEGPTVQAKQPLRLLVFSDQKKGGKKPSNIEKKRPGIFIPCTIVARFFRFKLVGMSIPYSPDTQPYLVAIPYSPDTAIPYSYLTSYMLILFDIQLCIHWCWSGMSLICLNCRRFLWDLVYFPILNGEGNLKLIPQHQYTNKYKQTRNVFKQGTRQNLVEPGCSPKCTERFGYKWIQVVCCRVDVSHTTTDQYLWVHRKRSPCFVFRQVAASQNFEAPLMDGSQKTGPILCS